MTTKWTRCSGRKTNGYPCWKRGYLDVDGRLYCKFHHAALVARAQTLGHSRLRAEYDRRRDLSDKAFVLWCVNLVPRLLDELIERQK